MKKLVQRAFSPFFVTVVVAVTTGTTTRTSRLSLVRQTRLVGGNSNVLALQKTTGTARNISYLTQRDDLCVQKEIFGQHSVLKNYTIKTSFGVLIAVSGQNLK